MTNRLPIISIYIAISRNELLTNLITNKQSYFTIEFATTTIDDKLRHLQKVLRKVSIFGSMHKERILANIQYMVPCDTSCSLLHT